jgi:hypothetical protein
MAKNYLIYGVKRTGNHAIINWLIPQIRDSVRFFNDQKYPLLDFTQPEFNRDEEHCLVEHVLKLDSDTRVYVKNQRLRSGDSYLPQYNDIDNIISFEGVEFNKVCEVLPQWLEDFNRGLKIRNPNLVVSDDFTHIILLRNPWNIAASQIRWSLDRVNYNRVDRDMVVWNEYHDHYINQNSDTHFIIYDKWFGDIEYRKAISIELGTEFTDINKNKTALAGGGSSFDKMKFDGKAEEMNVLNRYEEMMHHKKMQDFVKTDMANEVKNKWNHICDLEEIKDLKIK